MSARSAALALAGAGVTLAPQAAAVEREHHLGLDAGGSMLLVGDKSGADVGIAVGAHWAYGLNDAFNLMIEGAWSLVAPGERAEDAKTPKTRPATAANLGIGVGYVFDVLRWVPYAGVLVGGYALAGGTIDSPKILPGITLGAGLDYRLGRNWSVGGAFRQHVLATETSAYPSFTQLFARIEYTWGW